MKFSVASLISVLAILALLCTTGVSAQSVKVYPPVLYGGMNEITISSPHGLARVQYYRNGRWTPIITGTTTTAWRVISSPMFVRCAQSAKLRLFVTDIAHDFAVRLRVEECNGGRREFALSLENTWKIYYEDFGRVLMGATACHTFRVDATSDFVVDRVVSPSRQFTIRYRGDGRPPTRVRGAYLYDVCFKATKPGRVKMPILVYVRRRYPAGGHNTFIVADTAFVTVVAPRRRPTPPRGNPPRVNPPRVNPPRVNPPVIPPPPPRATVKSVAVIEVPRVAPKRRGNNPHSSDPLPVNPGESPLMDPTTHRAVLMPVARGVDSGRIFVSNYEVAGILVGYGVNDRLTLLAGGLYIPDAIDYNAVATAGARYEFIRNGSIRVAAGAQLSYSRSDVSAITLGAPYIVASLGDDDQRISLAGGYSWRHHSPFDTTTPPFDRQAAAVAIGGDYRIARHWKIAGEAFLLEEATYRPIIATLRYFNTSFAIDGGVAVIMQTNSSEIVVAPMVSFVWVW